MSIKKKLLALLPIVLAFSFIFATPAHADDFSVEANAGYAIDAESGKILFNQNGDTPLGIASVTKILSAYLVLEAVKNNQITWETPVPISTYAADLSTVAGLSNVPLTTTDTYTVKDLFDGMLIESGNACAVALAELISGNEPQFVNQMRERLTTWGITDAKIVTASGLPVSFSGDNRYPGTADDDENLMSARDVAIVAQKLVTDYPEVLQTTSITEMTFGANTSTPTAIETWNELLPGQDHYMEGVDGLKTGTTDLAGACFAGTITRDGRRIITVILNATNEENDSSARFVETAKLMNYAFDNWRIETIDTSQMNLPESSLNVIDGKAKKVDLKLDGQVQLWVRNDMNVNDVTIDANYETDKLTNQSLTAPVSKDETIGTAEISLAQDTLGYLVEPEKPTADILTTQAVAKENIFILTWNKILAFFS